MKQNSAILRDAFRQEKEKKLRQIVDKQIVIQLFIILDHCLIFQIYSE